MEIKDFFKSRKTFYKLPSNVTKDTTNTHGPQQLPIAKVICSDLMLSADMSPPKKKQKPAPSIDSKTVDRVEQISYELRQFDLNGRFGPLSGMTRMERWQRAFELGKNPPSLIKSYLEDEELRKLIPTIKEHLWFGVIDLKLP
jgi:DNA polymerase delta subunit 4